MNLSDIAIKRPITTFMVFIAIVMIGAFSLSKLAIDLMPDIEFPTLTVSTSYPGASPKEDERLITETVERAVSTVQNDVSINIGNFENLVIELDVNDTVGVDNSSIGNLDELAHGRRGLHG